MYIYIECDHCFDKKYFLLRSLNINNFNIKHYNKINRGKI